MGIATPANAEAISEQTEVAALVATDKLLGQHASGELVNIKGSNLNAATALHADDAANSVLLGGKSPANTANNIPVRSSLNQIVGPISRVGYLHSNNNTEAALFNMLSPLIPNAGDSMSVHGGICWNGSPTHDFVVSFAVRYSASRIDLYLYSFDAHKAEIGHIDEGSTGGLYASLSW